MHNRREILTALGLALGACAIRPRTETTKGKSPENLVPTKLSTAPNYWCTWAAQNYLYGQGTNPLDITELEGNTGSIHAQTLLNEQILLGSHGWSKHVHPRVHSELYLVLDHGWSEDGTASFKLDRAKFSSFTGSPQERIHGLNQAIRADGWRSLALWCRDTPGGSADEERIEWCKFADIPYLKVDGGDRSGSLTRARASQQAPLVLEHIFGEGPLNGEWRNDGRFGPQPWGSHRQKILATTDVYRAYDATAVLGIPTTLDRAAELLKGASGHTDARALVNLEDEVYIAAALGCTMGVMRHPYRGLRPGIDADVFLPQPRQLKQRMDEVVRAIRWQRIAPPFSAGIGSIALSDDILTDDWIFSAGETFDAQVVGQRTRQGAPGRIARAMELPEVTSKGERPYLVCTQFPGGPTAIVSLERVSAEQKVRAPRADVRWKVGSAPGPFGIFGRFASLTLQFDKPVRPARILAQDLAGDTPIDITDQIKFGGLEISIPGELIDRVGLVAATPGDLSPPGLVLVI